ncbi:MAG: hypothetical protein JXA54_01335 [Candidatus Heimdallarchaeota archaeon]|nr:hypothetical protein [Candidatus Heimdallarchaeota archaeon]
MTDFVSIKRNLLTEKDRLERLEQIIKQKVQGTSQEITNALANLENSENNIRVLESKLNDRKNDEIALENQKKGLKGDIDSLQEQTNRINLAISEEENKNSKLTTEINNIQNDLSNKINLLSSTEAQLADVKSKNITKQKEKSDITTRMTHLISEAQNMLTSLEEEKTKDTRVNPIIDFLLKEVRIDIPEVEILSVLAYRNQAMGLEELKKAVSKTPPVIILKVIRNLDSKGIIKYDERLDTIEITANMV